MNQLVEASRVKAVLTDFGWKNLYLVENVLEVSPKFYVSGLNPDGRPKQAFSDIGFRDLFHQLTGEWMAEQALEENDAL